MKVWSGVHVWRDMRLSSEVNIGSTMVRLLGKKAWSEAGLLDEVTLWDKVKMGSEVRV